MLLVQQINQVLVLLDREMLVVLVMMLQTIKAVGAGVLEGVFTCPLRPGRG